MARLRPAFSGVAVALASLAWVSCKPTPETLVIGSKNFTEQDLLGELVAVWIEETTDIPVSRRLHLAGTFICHQAITSGDIDLYVEYTGTALSAILELPPGGSPDAVYESVQGRYAKRFDLTWTEPLGFENTFAMVVRGQTADSLGLETLSDAAAHTPSWVPGFGFEFAERKDGFKGLSAAYGLTFAAPPRIMDLGLMYRALAAGDVDFIAGNSTDAQIDLLGLTMLADDRHYFPPYFAAPVVRDEALRRYPALRPALRALSASISTEEMRRLNSAVDVEGRGYREVARDWVERHLAETG